MLIHLPSTMHGIVSNATIDPGSRPTSPAINAESSIMRRISMYLTKNLIINSPRLRSILEALPKSKLIKNKNNKIKIRKSNFNGIKIIAKDKVISKKIRYVIWILWIFKAFLTIKNSLVVSFLLREVRTKTWKYTAKDAKASKREELKPVLDIKRLPFSTVLLLDKSKTKLAPYRTFNARIPAIKYGLKKPFLIR